jgi:hypothetical protein
MKTLEAVSKPHLIPNLCVARLLKIKSSSASGGLRFFVGPRLELRRDLGLVRLWRGFDTTSRPIRLVKVG